jgi:hypothetical protein
VVRYHWDSGYKVARSRFQGGRGQWKALLWTVVLLFLAYAAFKIIPAYVANYELVDKMQEQARFGVVNRYSAEQVRDVIYKTVQDLDIPATREQIIVEASDRIVKISMDYKVPVDLMIYRTELHFSPSSQNRSLW